MEFLIDVTYFENFTVIDTDFDANKKLNTHLVDAHKVQVYELLGKDLYNRLQTALDTPGSDPDADTLADLSDLKDFTLKATELNLIPFLNTPVTAKGTQERTGNFSQSASGTDRGLRLDKVRALLEVYAMRVRDYIRENSDIYPEYLRCKNIDQNFYSGIHGV